MSDEIDIELIFQKNSGKLANYLQNMVGEEEAIDIVQLTFEKFIIQLAKKKLLMKVMLQPGCFV